MEYATVDPQMQLLHFHYVSKGNIYADPFAYNLVALAPIWNLLAGYIPYPVNYSLYNL